MDGRCTLKKFTGVKTKSCDKGCAVQGEHQRYMVCVVVYAGGVRSISYSILKIVVIYGLSAIKTIYRRMTINIFPCIN